MGEPEGVVNESKAEIVALFNTNPDLLVKHLQGHDVMRDRQFVITTPNERAAQGTGGRSHLSRVTDI